MERNEVLAERDTIINQIKQYVPLIAPFFDLDLTIGEYSKWLYEFTPSPVHQERQRLVKEKISEKFNRIFGSRFEQETHFGFEPVMALSIVDHQMVLSHPFLASGNIVSSVHKFLQAKKPLPIIVVASGDVPPNNYFSKSGFAFHNKRVPLFSVSEREFTSYYIKKRAFNFVDRLKTIGRWKKFTPDEQEFLLQHQKFINSLDYSNCENYIDQITLIVKNTWPLIFEEKLRVTVPDLLYITQEELITECLIELLEEDTFVSRAFFDPEFRSAVLENFRGIVTTWRESEQKGTHFFWKKYPGQERSLRMYTQGDYLVPQDPRFADQKVHLDKQTIIELLKTREIYPSLFTIFSVLNFYTGVRPLTGFGSVVYLALFKDAWLKTLEQFSMTSERELVSQVNTSGLITGPVVIFSRINGQVRAPYGHDLMMEGGMKRDYLKHVFGMKFKEVLSVGAADMYDYFCNKYIPKNVQIKKRIFFDDLASITFDWI